MPLHLHRNAAVKTPIRTPKNASIIVTIKVDPKVLELAKEIEATNPEAKLEYRDNGDVIVWNNKTQYQALREVK